MPIVCCKLFVRAARNCHKHLLVYAGFGQAGSSHSTEPDGRKQKKRKSSGMTEANSSHITAVAPAVEAEPAAEAGTDRKKSKKRKALGANAAGASEISPAAQPETKGITTKTIAPARNVSAELDGQPLELTKPKKRNTAGLTGAKVTRTAASSAEPPPAADTGKSAKRKKRTQKDGVVKV